MQSCQWGFNMGKLKLEGQGKYLRVQQSARARKNHVGTYVLSSEEVNNSCITDV